MARATSEPKERFDAYYLEQEWQTDRQRRQVAETCEACNGAGEHDGEECSLCRGTGEVEV